MGLVTRGEGLGRRSGTPGTTGGPGGERLLGNGFDHVAAETGFGLHCHAAAANVCFLTGPDAGYMSSAVLDVADGFQI